MFEMIKKVFTVVDHVKTAADYARRFVEAANVLRSWDDPEDSDTKPELDNIGEDGKALFKAVVGDVQETIKDGAKRISARKTEIQLIVHRMERLAEQVKLAATKEG